jgi:hypothetical protein
MCLSGRKLAIARRSLAAVARALPCYVRWLRLAEASRTLPGPRRFLTPALPAFVGPRPSGGGDHPRKPCRNVIPLSLRFSG